MPELPFLGGAYEGIVKTSSVQSCINHYFEPAKDIGGRDMLLGTPGYATVHAVCKDTSLTGITFSKSGTSIGVLTSGAHGYINGQVISVSSVTDPTYDKTDATVQLAAEAGFSFTHTSEPTSASVTDGVMISNESINGVASAYRGQVRALYVPGGTRKPASNQNQICWAVVGNRLCYLDASAGSAPYTFLEADTTSNYWQRRFASIAGPVQLQSIGRDFGDGVLACDAWACRFNPGGVGVVTTTSGYPVPRKLQHTGTHSGSTSTTVASSGVISNTVTFQDGYLIRDDVSEPGKFVWSDLYDVTTENVFDFAITTGSIDDCLGVLADRRRLWVFGATSTEIWYNAAIDDPTVPFERFQGGFSETGIVSPLTAVKCNGTVMWLAQNEGGIIGVVQAGQGFQPTLISPPMINNKIREYTSPQDSSAYRMNWNGHEWYVLTFNDAADDVTWVYDATAQNWHQWQSGSSGSHAGMSYAYLFDAKFNTFGTDLWWGNEQIIGGNDYRGSLYILDAGFPQVEVAATGTSSVETTNIYRERTGFTYYKEQDRLRISEFQLDMDEAAVSAASYADTAIDNSGGYAAATTVIQVDSAANAKVSRLAGVTLTDGTIWYGIITATDKAVPGSITFADFPLPSACADNAVVTLTDNKAVTLEVSKNNGNDWSTVNLKIINERGTGDDARIIWRKLGWARNWTFRVKTQTLGVAAIIGAFVKSYGEPR